MKSATVELDSIKLFGKMTKAVVRGESLKLRLEFNDKEGNNARPDFKSFDGVSVWINEEDEKLPF